MSEEYEIVLLIPFGSSTEKQDGISHLFEHIIISNIVSTYKKFDINGYTTEDYIVLFFSSFNLKRLSNVIREFKITETELVFHKNILINELKNNLINKEEMFFSEIWKNTKYEKSPLGNIEEIKNITRDNLYKFKLMILRDGYLIFTKKKVLNMLSNICIKKKKKNFDLLLIKDLCFEKNTYKVIYFTGQVEQLYVIERILRLLNNNKLIQISEKKEMSALIIEKGTFLPDFNHIKTYKEDAIKLIINETKTIKENFKEIALNELEGRFFYNKTWEQRIDLLKATNDEDLFNIISIIKEKKNE